MSLGKVIHSTGDWTSSLQSSSALWQDETASKQVVKSLEVGGVSSP